MNVILLERVEKLGQMGDLVKVKPGYARNFLLPRGKALRATEENKKRFEDERAQREKESATHKTEAEKLAAKMKDLNVVLIRAASETGQLYGSASSRDIASAIAETDFTVERHQVELNEALKTLGIFPVRVVLHPEVAVEVQVNIARSADEAVEQQRIGRAIVSDIGEAEAIEEEQVEEKLSAEQAAEMLEESAITDSDVDDSGDDSGDDSPDSSKDDSKGDSGGDSPDSPDDTVSDADQSDSDADDSDADAGTDTDATDDSDKK